MQQLRNIPNLKTERLILCEHVIEDRIPIEHYATQEKFWRFLQIGELTEGCGQAFVERALKEQEQIPRLQFNLAVVLKAGTCLIGSVRIGISNPAKKAGNLGYGLNPAYWGHGYATEAINRLIQFSFQDLALHRISATCDVENQASCRVMEKLGMTREGLLRDNELYKGEWRSSFVYSILEHEFSRPQRSR